MVEGFNTIGERIRAARENCGLTQQELAGKTGFNSGQTISTIEKGERDVKALELNNIAKALYKDISYFLTSEETEKTYRVIWRDERAEDAKEKEAYFLNKCEEYYHLERLLDETADFALPRFEFSPKGKKDGFEKAGAIADDVYRILNLGPRPALVLRRVLEETYGIKIWYLDLGEAGSAASVRGDFGPAIVMNRNEAPWRRHFSLAHELFHLMTWESYLKTECRGRVEQFANKFASVLLLPCDELRKGFEKKVKNNTISYIDLVTLIREFAVSAEAFLWRLYWLGLLPKETIRELLGDEIFLSLDRETKSDIEWEETGFPNRFIKLGVASLVKGKLSKGQLARYMEINVGDLNYALKGYGFKIADLQGGANEVSVRC